MSTQRCLYFLVFVLFSLPHYSHAQNHSRDIKNLQAKISTDANDGVSRLQLTLLLFLDKRYTEVTTEGAQALIFFPNRPSLYYQVGESFRQLNNIAQANEYLEKGYKIKQSIDGGASYALALLRLNKKEEALQVLQSVVKEDTGFVSKHLANGNAAFAQNKLDLAIDEYYAVSLLNISRLTEEQVAFVQFRANFKNYVQSQNIDLAVARFVQVATAKLGKSLRYDDLRDIFRCLLEQQQYDTAQQLYNDVVALPQSTITQDTLDEKYFSLCYNLFSQCPALRTTTITAFKRLARVHLDMGDDELSPLYTLYDFTLEQKATSISNDIIQRVLSLNKESGGSGYERVVTIFINYNKIPEAVLVFKKLLTNHNIDALGYSADLARVFEKYLQQAKIDDGKKLLSELLTINPKELIPTYITFGDLFTNAGEGEKAVGLLKKVLALDPTNNTASNKLGEAYLAAGKFNDLIADFTAVTTKEGRRFIALGYESKLMLAEANQAWREVLTKTTEQKEVDEANNHIRNNTITMMSPEFQKVKAMATTGKISIIIDTPLEASEISGTSAEIKGRIIHSSEIADIKLNNISVGKGRGMKALQQPPQDAQQNVAAAETTAFSYPIELTEGENTISMVAYTTTNDTARIKLKIKSTATPNLNPEVASELTQLPQIRQNQAYAVIIGVANYKDEAIPKLKYTVNDARAVYEILTNPLYGGFKKENVKLLLDEEATVPNIKAAIGSWLPKNTPEDATVVIYFAGHGAPEGDQTYWLTYEANINDLYSSSLSNDEIATMLSRVKTNRVLSFLDCCFSQATINRTVGHRSLIIDDPFKQYKGKGRVTITASDGKQESIEDDEIKHGIFTQRLIEGLQGKADKDSNGVVFMDELWGYVNKTVVADAKHRGHMQTPTIDGSYTAEIPLARNPETAFDRFHDQQKNVFKELFRGGKIDGKMYQRIKEVLEAKDEEKPKIADIQTKRKAIREYINKTIDLNTFLELFGN